MLWAALHSLEGDDAGVTRQLCTTVLRALASLAVAASRSHPVASSVLEPMTSRDNLQALLGYLSIACTLALDTPPAESAVAFDRASSACRILGAVMRSAPSQLALAEVGDPESILRMLQALLDAGASKVRCCDLPRFADWAARASRHSAARSTAEHRWGLQETTESRLRCVHPVDEAETNSERMDTPTALHSRRRVIGAPDRCATMARQR